MKIPFSTSSYPGAIPQEGGGRLVNAMAEKMGDGIKYIRSPGVSQWATSGQTGYRGMAVSATNTLYAAFLNVLYKTSISGGAMTQVGSLSGSLPVSFAFNQAITPDQVVVTEDGAFTFTNTTVAGSYPDIDLPQPNDVCFGSGFFFFTTGQGRCYASGVNSTSIDPTQFITAESKPDTLFRCIYFQEQLYLIGPDSIEVWGKPINATGFPLNRITVIPRGVIAARAITGYENGIDLGLLFVSGNNQVMRLNGYIPERISNPDLERQISALTDRTTLEMTSFVSGAHMLLKIRSPTWCWFYDFTTQTWHERQSYLSSTSRLKSALYAFGLWLVGDANSGNLGRFQVPVFTEFGQPLVWVMESQQISGFPNRVVVGPAYFQFTPGQGISGGIDPIQTNPSVRISWSDDGGLNFDYNRVLPLGREGKTTQLVRTFLTGSIGPYGRIWRLQISDPVYISFIGGEMPKIKQRVAA